MQELGRKKGGGGGGGGESIFSKGAYQPRSKGSFKVEFTYSHIV